MERRTRTIEIPHRGRYEIALRSQGPSVRLEYLERDAQRFVKLDTSVQTAVVSFEEPTTASLFWRGDVAPSVEVTRLGDLF